MTTLIVLGIIAVVLTAVLTARVGVRVSFGGGENVKLWVIVGLFKKQIKLDSMLKGGDEPKPEPEIKPEAKPQNDEVESKPEDKPKDKSKDKPAKSDKTSFLDKYDKKKLIKLGFRAFKGILKLPHIDILELNYIAGGESADKIAVSYGRMCAAIGVALPFINKYSRIKNWRITTDMDYTSLKSKYAGRVQITVTIGAVFAFGIWALVEFLKCKNKEEK